MKRAAIALAGLILTAVLCITALINFENAISDVISRAEDMAQAVKQHDNAAAANLLSDLEQTWQQNKSFFVILSGSDPCDKIDLSLTQVKVWFSQKEKSPETLSELYNLIKEAEDLRQTQSPKLINLF